jgi:predicted negative regulator of RcsB-dependent stress response
VETYQPDDQVERLKAWWKQYGNALIAGVIIGIVLLFGGKYWQQHKATQAEVASRLYQALLGQLSPATLAEAKKIVDQLKHDHAGTPYAGKAALMVARLQFDAGQTDVAMIELRWAEKHATEAATGHAARLKLARLLADQGKIDEAMALAGEKKAAGFESEYAELRGDLLMTQKKPDEARTAYAEAVQAAGQGPYARVLQMKLDNLGAPAERKP